MSPIVTVNGSGAQRIGRPRWVDPDATFTPNLPSGLAIIGDVTFDNTYSNAGGSGSQSYKGWSFGWLNRTKVWAEAGAPSGTGYTLGSLFTDGQTDGYGSQASCQAFTGSLDATHLYFAWTFKAQSGFIHETNGHKLVYPTALVDGVDKKAYVGLRRASSPVDGGRATLTLEQMARWDAEFSIYNFYILYPNRNGYSQASPYWLNNGSWYRVEWEQKLETPGVTSGTLDGIARLWVSEWNGSAFGTPVLISEYTDVGFGFTRAASTIKWAGGVLLDTYRGGSGSPTLTADQYLYVDRMAIAVEA